MNPIWEAFLFAVIYGPIILITFVMLCGICGLGHTPKQRNQK